MASSLIALTVVSLVLSPSRASAADQSKPVVFVHGYENDSGANCDVVWNDMKDALAAQGWTGPLIDVAYYVNDTGCGGSINQDGSHTAHYASGHSGGGHTTGTNIRHLGFHLAWWIYDHYGKSGQCIEAVGHSMGGLIIRYAIARAARGYGTPRAVWQPPLRRRASGHARARSLRIPLGQVRSRTCGCASRHL